MWKIALAVFVAWCAMFVVDQVVTRKGYHTHHLDHYETHDDEC